MDPTIGLPSGQKLASTCSGTHGRPDKGICKLRILLTKGGGINRAAGYVPGKWQSRCRVTGRGGRTSSSTRCYPTGLCKVFRRTAITIAIAAC